MIISLPYPPSANRYWRHVGPRVLLSREARAYKLMVAHMCKLAKLEPLDGPICVTYSVYRPAKRGDLDNLFKVISDSLQGHMYQDDSQVVEIHAFRAEDKENPRVVVSVKAA